MALGVFPNVGLVASPSLRFASTFASSALPGTAGAAAAVAAAAAADAVRSGLGGSDGGASCGGSSPGSSIPARVVTSCLSRWSAIRRSGWSAWRAAQLTASRTKSFSSAISSSRLGGFSVGGFGNGGADDDDAPSAQRTRWFATKAARSADGTYRLFVIASESAASISAMGWPPSILDVLRAFLFAARSVT